MLHSRHVDSRAAPRRVATLARSSRATATLACRSRVTATLARRSRVGAASVHAPIAVLANYFHDSIPVDGVWVEDGKGDRRKRRTLGSKWDRL